MRQGADDGRGNPASDGVTMELNSKSFVPSALPEKNRQAARPGSNLGSTRSARRSTFLPLLSNLLAAFADTIEPATTHLLRRRRWIAMQSQPGDIDFYRADASGATPVGNSLTVDERVRRQMSLNGAELELRLPTDLITSTTIKVPAGGLDYLEQIIENRLDRLTPWKPDKVFYGYVVSQKPGADGQFDVSFIATPKDVVAKSIGQLAVLGLTPSRMGSAAESASRPLTIDLFRGRNDTSRLAQRRVVGIAAATALLLSGLVYGASVFAQFESEQQLAELDSTLAQLREKMFTGEGNSAERRRDVKLIQGKKVGDTRLALIDHLAAALPDNTFLDEMDIQPGSVRIAGTSTEASSLIAILQSKVGLSDARFSAPVTREADGRDRFDITGTLPGPHRTSQ